MPLSEGSKEPFALRWEELEIRDRRETKIFRQHLSIRF
jgi:hypothetical protein